MKEQLKLLLEQNKLLVQKLTVSGTEPSRKPRKPSYSDQERKEYNKKPFLYCYTCGYQKDHKSSDCSVSWKARNHKNTATLTNNQGGNQERVGLYKRSINV